MLDQEKLNLSAGSRLKKRYNLVIFYLLIVCIKERVMQIVEMKHLLIKYKFGLMWDKDINTKRFR